MKTYARRLGAVAITAALATAPTLVGPSARAATNSYGYSAADWLTAQLRHGVVHNDQYDFDDYGLSLDVYFALNQLGRPGAAASVLGALDDAPGAYIGSGSEKYSGATGKLATAVERGGQDPTAYGGVDLVARTESLVDTTHAGEIGRGVDQSQYGDYSNTIGQSFVVRALAGAGSGLADEATGFLVQQQCTAGFFREGFEAATATTSSFACDGASPAAGSSIDATAFAVEALTEARAHGVTGLDDALTRAANWLVGQQASDGSFLGNGTANTNTTGLAAAALVLAGRTTEAQRAAAWVSRRQVTDTMAQDSPKLAGDVGAIAYDGPALTAGRTDGIPVDQQDQWRRATSQAAIGVNAVKTLAVTAPAGFVHGGSTVTLRLAGLAPNERWTVRLGDVKSVRGLASATGTASPRVSLPRSTRAYTVRAVGASSARTGKASLRVLGPRTFKAALGSRPIKRGRTQRVTVSGLAPRELVRLSYRGDRIWSGRASTSGTVAHSFKAGRSLGRKKLTARGAFADRSVTTYFRVVR